MTATSKKFLKLLSFENPINPSASIVILTIVYTNSVLTYKLVKFNYGIPITSVPRYPATNPIPYVILLAVDDIFAVDDFVES